MDENARKRKREEEELSDIEGIEREKPLRAMKTAEQQAKRQKRGDTDNLGSIEPVKKARSHTPEDSIQALQKGVADKKREKKLHKKAKAEAKALKRKAKKARKEQQAPKERDTTASNENRENSSGESDEPKLGDIKNIDVTGLLNESQENSPSTATSSPTPPSPIFDTLTTKSGSSSVSSVAPHPIGNAKSQAQKPLDEPVKSKTDPEELKIRLQKRIEELRVARKADGLDGKPARSRQELIEARRQKEGKRRARKKELRQKAKEEERQKQELIMSRGSPLLSSQYQKSFQHNPEQANNFSFGRITFPGGQHTSAELSTILPSPKPKGPQDPQTALQALQNKNSRLSALDPSKKKDILEKDVWLNARKHVHGEVVRDDASLLKKTLKRKEKAKKKSEKEWTARIEGVEKGIAARQKKREDNLRKRRESKGKPGGKKVKAKAKSKTKSKARPGFEGSFRAKPLTNSTKGK